MKRCTKCKRDLEPADFHKRKASKDGIEHQCKKCKAAYYQANRERADARDKKWRKENPERASEIRRKANAKLAKKNPDYHKEWRKANPEKWREYVRRSEKPENSAARRARFRLNNPGYFSAQRKIREIELVPPDELAIRQTGRCGICSEPLFEPIEIDHIVPLSRGGGHTEDNCQLTHRSCNRQKQNKLPEECGPIRPLSF